jgi:tRNA uridine 5-carboxymethylaminomethyl modification enzyme
MHRPFIQAREIDGFRRAESASLRLPPDIKYTGMPALSAEEQELLATARPATIAAAGRIPGVRPSTLMLLYQASQRFSREQKRSRNPSDVYPPS